MRQLSTTSDGRGGAAGVRLMLCQHRAAAASPHTHCTPQSCLQTTPTGPVHAPLDGAGAAAGASCFAGLGGGGLSASGLSAAAGLAFSAGGFLGAPPLASSSVYPEKAPTES